MANSDLRVRVDKVKLEQLIAQSPQKAGLALRQLALRGEGIIKGWFGTSLPGRQYRHGTAIHIASRPGWPPNVDTGKLRNAIHVERRAVLTQVISTGDVEYAPSLEYGTTQMAARPFMRPVVPILSQESADVFDGFLD